MFGCFIACWFTLSLFGVVVFRAVSCDCFCGNLVFCFVVCVKDLWLRVVLCLFAA